MATKIKFDPAKLASVVMAKTASGMFGDEGLPPTSLVLQEMVGDPNDEAISTFAQFKPNPGGTQLPNPLSPIQGDDIFFTYMLPGAVFQSHDGQQWIIEDYDYDAKVEITNRWYPRMNGQVSVNDIRRSIAAWVEPVQVPVPAPPPGVTYGAQQVIVVNRPDGFKI